MAKNLLTRKTTPYKLRRYQIAGVNKIIKKFNCRALLADEMGVGKAIANGTNVLTPTGWKAIETLTTNDKVCGSDGKFHAVLGVFPQGMRECYEITFNKQNKIVCDEDHLWMAHTLRDRHKKRDFRILTAKEIVEDGATYKNCHGVYSKWYLPSIKPVEFEEKQHLISPRMLAILIAEGTLKHGMLFTTGDQEIADFIKDEIQKNGYEFSRCQIRKYHHTIIGNDKINIYKQEIKRLGLNKNGFERFIPDEYLYDSASNRFSMLCGFMDTDGTVSKSCYEYDTASERLAKDIQFLAESLGCIATIHVRTTKYKGKDGEYINCRLCYRIRVRPPAGVELFTLPRHLKKYHAKEHKYHAAVKISSIEPVGKRECTCIAIDSPDHLYVTEHCILTHNTSQAIFVIKRTKDFPALVCVPAFLKYNWVAELKKFAPEFSVFVCSGQKPKLPKKKFDIYIINYDILQFWVAEFLKLGVRFLVFDESHFLKNKAAKRTKAALKLSQRVSKCLLMTGTPIENRPVEIFYQIALLDNSIFPNWLKFAKRYNSCRRTMWGWQMGKAKNTQELNDILLSKCMIRRKKEDVLTELPPIIRQVIPIDIDNRDEYREAENDIIEWIAKNTELNIQKVKKVEAQIRLDKLKLISAEGKLNQIANWLLEESQNQKLVVFCYHKKILAELNSKLRNHILFSAEVPTGERQGLVNMFQEDNSKRIFLTTLRVGGTGLTLTASHTTVFVQLDWSPSIHDQAEARVHRIGQEADSVNAIYFIGRNTVEEKILGLIDGKRSDIRKVIDGEEAGEDEILTNLLSDFQKRLKDLT